MYLIYMVHKCEGKLKVQTLRCNVQCKTSQEFGCLAYCKNECVASIFKSLTRCKIDARWQFFIKNSSQNTNLKGERRRHRTKHNVIFFRRMQVNLRFRFSFLRGSLTFSKVLYSVMQIKNLSLLE